MSAHLGIMLAITGGALGQLLMKSGLQSISLTDMHSVYYNITYHALPSLMIATGIAGYVMSMAVWVHTLKNHPLNQAIPYLSLSYVLVCVLATVWPGIEEQMTLQKAVGVALIIVGVWYTQSPPEDTSTKQNTVKPEISTTPSASKNAR